MNAPHETAPCRRSVIAAGILISAGTALLTADSAVTTGARDPRSPRGRANANGGRESTADSVDWEALLNANPETVGWLDVAGAGISLPIVQPREPRARTFYLSHGFGGSPDAKGTPYLDVRCTAMGPHLLIFGHHVIGGEREIFSPIHRSFDPDVFTGIDDARWRTPAGTDARFDPLCALRVDEGYQPIQRFGFADADTLRAWLASILDGARARSPDADALARKAGAVLTLVTCSSERTGQPDRALTIFCRSVRADYDAVDPESVADDPDEADAAASPARWTVRSPAGVEYRAPTT